MTDIPMNPTDIKAGMMVTEQEPEEKMCPICGAYSKRSCELRDTNGGECPWDMMQECEP